MNVSFADIARMGATVVRTWYGYPFGVTAAISNENSGASTKLPALAAFTTRVGQMVFQP